MMGCATRLTLSLTPSLPCKPISTWSLPFHSSQITYLPLFITPLQLSNRCALSSCCKRNSVEVVTDASNEFVVVNFYRFVSIKDPQLEVSKHLSFLQYSGPSKDALAYFQWLREDHRFSEVLVQISPALKRHAFPRLKLRYKPSLVQLVRICWRTLLARGKSSATHGFLCAIKGHRVSGGIRAAVAQGTVASAKNILWNSLLRKTMANMKERMDALEAQIQSMFKSDQDAPGILKQFSLRLDALEVNVEATDNARYAENMDWEGKFQELQDRAFSALMLDISDMSAVDRLFFFMERLKPWARTELNRRRVNNLNEAIIAAESLSDYNSEPQRPPQRGNPSRSNGVKKPGGQAPNQSWGSKSSWASKNSSTLQKSGVGFKAKPDASTSGEVKKPAFRGCFLCQGPHVIANCPQRQMMNAFFDNMGQVQRGEQSGSQSRHPPTEEQTDTQDYEEEDAVGAFPQWCNAVTTQVRNPEESSTGEKPKDMPPKKKSDVPRKGLMYVDIKVNGKAIKAMVDTGATHNYISSTEVERLGLTLEKGCGRVKAINSAAQPVAGIARSVLIKIGPYKGRTNFSVVIMDDFKLILGLEFLRDTKTTVMPCTNSLAMLGSKPCVIPTARWQELLAEFNFMLEYRAGSTNSVADALSRRAELDQVALMAMNAIVRADSRVAINIGKKIRKALTRDPVAQQLLKLIESGKSAFEIVNGQPLLPHTVNVPNAGKSPRAISFSEEWRQNIDLAHSYLEKAARRMKKHADKNRRSQEFNVGDKVMVKLLPQDRKFLRGRDSRLLQKYEGPLTIVKKIGKMAYKVDPPNWWSRQLHPVFHVSMLKPFYEDTADPSRGQIKRPGLKPKAAGKRVAEAILNDRIVGICTAIGRAGAVLDGCMGARLEELARAHGRVLDGRGGAVKDGRGAGRVQGAELLTPSSTSACGTPDGACGML
ncbi:hypothetical protein RJ640_027893 [Escallonia rubra]|uniref:Tf2-1-like SH3-like domain-containing protein n=1 Tax=Escallonia rubra TaxID=112253 RepID=A0AA88RET0_9ASTE|nr:hypothetical protein RJ640_027893 [Escallonia rubra]